MGIERDRRERMIDRAVVAAYAVIAMCATLLHEPWLDEAQHWCLARDSASLADLWRNTAIEGHPPLWHWTLWCVTRCTHDMDAMRALHVMIAIAAVALLVLRSPLPAAVRWLLPFGYFFAYEYAAIARNYAPGVLLLFAVCALRDDRRWWWRTLLLSALALTHLWGTVAVVAWCITRTGHVDLRARFIGPSRVLLVLPAVVLALWRIAPHGASPFGIRWHGLLTLDRMGATLMQLGQAWQPVPDWQATHPWNTQLMIPDHRLSLAWLGLLVTIAAWRAVPRQHGARAFFVCCGLGLTAFPWLTDLRGIRYTGTVVVAWIAAIWLGGGRLEKRAEFFSIVVLAFQVIGAGVILLVESRRDFSAGEELARAIAGSGHVRAPIVETRYTAGPVISALLDRQLVYPTVGATGSWCDWSRSPFMPEAQALRQAARMADADAFILLSAEAPRPTDFPGFALEPIHCVDDGMIPQENGCATFVRRTP